LFTEEEEEEEEVAKFSSSNTACDAKHREEEDSNLRRLTTTSRAVVVVNVFRAARIVLLFAVVALRLEIIIAEDEEEEEVDIHRFPCAPPPKVEEEGFIFVAMPDVNKEAEEESIVVIVRLSSIDYIIRECSRRKARAVFVRVSFFKKWRDGIRICKTLNNTKCPVALSTGALRPT